MAHRFDGRWKWCPACKIPRIKCLDPDCFGPSCNGRCSRCSDDFDEAIDMINNGTAPTHADFPNADADEIEYNNDPLGLGSLSKGTS